MKYNRLDNIGNVWNQSENAYISYKIFIDDIYLTKKLILIIILNNNNINNKSLNGSLNIVVYQYNE